jgi:hypothetical protein
MSANQLIFPVCLQKINRNSDCSEENDKVGPQAIRIIFRPGGMSDTDHPGNGLNYCSNREIRNLFIQMNENSDDQENQAQEIQGPCDETSVILHG